jgi:hypothetical protein
MDGYDCGNMNPPHEILQILLIKTNGLADLNKLHGYMFPHLSILQKYLLFTAICDMS